jgi:hypothetical protein
MFMNLPHYTIIRGHKATLNSANLVDNKFSGEEEAGYANFSQHRALFQNHSSSCKKLVKTSFCILRKLYFV